MPNNTCQFHDVTCKAATGAAILVEIEGEDFWIPITQVHDDSEVYRKGTEGTLIINDWWAEKKGLV